jgi:uncharacterized protein
MGESRSDDPPRLIRPSCTVLNNTRGVSLATRVRLAAHSSERRKGLLGVDNLDGDGGLWIWPCEAIHTFGMRMLIDVIFLDSQHVVRKIRRALAPNRLSVCISSSSVLELAAGTIAASGTEVNDRLEFVVSCT